jgi:hypothetical protein
MRARGARLFAGPGVGFRHLGFQPALRAGYVPD